MQLSFTLAATGGPFRQKPGYEELKKQFGAVVHMGGRGPYDIFLPQPAVPATGPEAEYMLYGVGPAPKGRGFFLTVAKGFTSFEVTIPLPTTNHDLEDAFTFIAMLAKWLGVRTVTRDDGDTISGEALYSTFPQIKNKNADLLKSYAISQPGFTLSTLTMPLLIPEKITRRIAMVPPDNGELYLSTYLSEKQIPGYSYLMPLFRRDKDTGAPFVSYALEEDVGYIIQKQPFLPMEVSPAGDEPITQWQVALVSRHLGVIGTVPYDVYLGFLDEKSLFEFDEKHFRTHGLSLQRMQALKALHRD